ncbi:LOG family protein [Calidifontibacter terrae]
MTLRRIAVFCASRPGADPAHLQTAYDTGNLLARNDIGLVYGGGGSGLMGAAAQGALDAGGEVIGVIPQSMVDREWGRHDITRLEIVDTMHERKARMASYADAFLALPGGIGTLEEIFEVWTWRTLDYHHKPVGFLNTGGFWNPLLDTIRAMVAAGFASREVLDEVVVADNIEQAILDLSR